MNAVEIADAITVLTSASYEAAEFPYAFLSAFGRDATTIKRLKSGNTNESDVGGVLQVKHIHLATCKAGKTHETLNLLRDSAATRKHKCKFILATDGEVLEAEDLVNGEPLNIKLVTLPEKFGFFLPLAGITTIKAIRENAVDILATNILNKLYTELLTNNPDWNDGKNRKESAGEDGSPMSKFMARLIFCFFAEDTDIFPTQGIFTHTLKTMTQTDGSNTHSVIEALFEVMNTPDTEKTSGKLKPWAITHPYVNGGLFYGDIKAPKFNRLSRSYLLSLGRLHWHEINPDIFGSMIQALADAEERRQLGMHYTSASNILKVLNPLFLDELRTKLVDAGKDKKKLKALRERISHIRVFDPACGSGNFLIIAYKELRAIEAEILTLLGETKRHSTITLNNFRGIELRAFPAEIARLSLIIAQYQCDRKYNDQRKFLPLDSENTIRCGNALQLAWLDEASTHTTTCTPSNNRQSAGSPQPTREAGMQGQIAGETYICGNPPYMGSTWQSASQKKDLETVFSGRTKSWKSLDYVAGWLMKAADYCAEHGASAAFVSTNSICQGQQVPILWPLVFEKGNHISFAYTSFKWKNLASHNAGVTVAIIGISPPSSSKPRVLFTERQNGKTNEEKDDSFIRTEVSNINGYLTAGRNVIVEKSNAQMSGLPPMSFGNKPTDGGHLLLTRQEVAELGLTREQKKRFIRRFYGSAEFIQGLERYCLWITDKDLTEASTIPAIKRRIDGVRAMRLASPDKGCREMATRAHQMREMNEGTSHTIIIPSVSSENREYLPVGYLPAGSIVSNAAFALYDAPLWNLAIIASRLHLVWIGTVCGKLKTDFRYSNTLGWNTFPIPDLTEEDKAALTKCAEDILLARDAHFPLTIADLYAPGRMPDNLRAAHDRNDELLEKIYIQRRFKNDTERLEKLFAMYAEKTSPSKGKVKQPSTGESQDSGVDLSKRPARRKQKPETVSPVGKTHAKPGTPGQPATLLARNSARGRQKATTAS